MAIKLRTLDRESTIRDFQVNYTVISATNDIEFNCVHKAKLKEVYISVTAAIATTAVLDIVNVTKSQTVCSAISIGSWAAKGSKAKAVIPVDAPEIAAGDRLKLHISGTITMSGALCTLVFKKEGDL